MYDLVLVAVDGGTIELEDVKGENAIRIRAAALPKHGVTLNLYFHEVTIIGLL